MNPPGRTGECLVDGQLKCTGKREFTKRGVRFAQLTLKRSNSPYAVKFTVPADRAAGVEIGEYYRIAILPDCAPDPPIPTKKLNPGDHVLEWWRWAGVKVWRPACLTGFTPGGRAIIRPWMRRESIDVKAKVANLTLALHPFPAPDDFTTIFVGDEMIWRDKLVTVRGFVSPDRAVITYPIYEPDGTPAFQSASRLVPISQMIPRILLDLGTTYTISSEWVK